MKITEIMYNPIGGEDGEFLELWNNTGSRSPSTAGRWRGWGPREE